MVVCLIVCLVCNKLEKYLHCNYPQTQMEAYHETSLSTKNGAHGHAHHDQGGGDIKEADQEMFTDPASCPR